MKAQNFLDETASLDPNLAVRDEVDQEAQDDYAMQGLANHIEDFVKQIESDDNKSNMFWIIMKELAKGHPEDLAKGVQAMIKAYHG